MIDTALVVVATDAGHVTGPGAEALTAARAVADTVEVVWLDETDPDLDGLTLHSVSRVWTAPGVNAAVSAAAAHVVRDAATQAGAGLVVLSSTFAGKDIAGELAVATGSGAVVDATGLRLDGGDIVATKSVLAGTWNTECVPAGPLPVVTLKANSIDVVEEPGQAAPLLQELEAELPERASRVRVVSVTPHERSGGVPLDQAATVVVGGRGLEGDFSKVTELAELLGGAVGATRVATDEGWIEHSAQIGQTGTMISPRLYIGCGVSGAIHHTAGMQAAEYVVAINNDPDAPIFELADLAVVGDLNDVVPQTIAELRKAQQA